MTSDLSLFMLRIPYSAVQIYCGSKVSMQLCTLGTSAAIISRTSGLSLLILCKPYKTFATVFGFIGSMQSLTLGSKACSIAIDSAESQVFF